MAEMLDDPLIFFMIFQAVYWTFAAPFAILLTGPARRCLRQLEREKEDREKSEAERPNSPVDAGAARV